jgi:hypothetical protein
MGDVRAATPGWYSARASLSGGPADLSPDILAAVGRLTMAAIQLEATARLTCGEVLTDRRGVGDRTPIGKRIQKARAALDPDGPGGDFVRVWLELAQRALDERNQVLHVTPTLVFRREGGGVTRLGPALDYGDQDSPDHRRTWLTVDDLDGLTDVIQSVLDLHACAMNRAGFWGDAQASDSEGAS